MIQLNKIFGLVKDTWIIFGITIVLFVLLESFLSFAFLVKDRSARPVSPVIDARFKADAYSDSSWSLKYYEEFQQSYTARWTPYVYWRRQPYHGNYINVDSDGIRLTPAPEANHQKAASPLRIFMFGGSTMWGTGARDHMTIPAILVRELMSKGISCQIINFGESGYVSTQEVIELLLQLQKKKIPDVVIFYDGANDTYSAYQQRVAGLPQNESNRAMEFNASKLDRTQLWGMAFRSTLDNLSIVKFFHKLVRRFGAPHRGETAYSSTFVRSPVLDDEVLAREVLATYINNIQLVNALAKQYRFKSLFYWQPTVFQKKHLTESERLSRDEARSFEPFFLKTYEIMQQDQGTLRTEDAFYDLSLIFSEVQEPIYVDWCHVAEMGNNLIAEKMARDVVALVGTN
jgi:hypothetical protein